MKQIIIPISMNNAKSVIMQANSYIDNISRALKKVKSDISANYIYFNNRGIVIITNKVAASLYLSIVK